MTLQLLFVCFHLLVDEGDNLSEMTSIYCGYQFWQERSLDLWIAACVSKHAVSGMLALFGQLLGATLPWVKISRVAREGDPVTDGPRQLGRAESRHRVCLIPVYEESPHEPVCIKGPIGRQIVHPHCFALLTATSDLLFPLG